MRTLIFLGLVISVLAGCASTSEILSVGKNTYRVSAEMGGQFPSWSDVKGLALTKANEFCQSKNMYMVEKGWETHGSRGWTPLNAELTFTCSSE